jgi:hypothetical protein
LRYPRRRARPERGAGESPDGREASSPVDVPDPLGWLAIDRPLEHRYGDAEPRRWGTIVSWRLGGPDPLDGVTADGRVPPDAAEASGGR